MLNEINLKSVSIIELNYRYIDTEEFTDMSKGKQGGKDLIFLTSLPLNPDHFLLCQVSPKVLSLSETRKMFLQLYTTLQQLESHLIFYFHKSTGFLPF